MRHERIRISRWTHRFERNGVTAILNSISLGLVFVSSETAQLLFDYLRTPAPMDQASAYLGADLIDALTKEGVIVAEELDDEVYLSDFREKLLRESTVELMYLLVTDHCNLRCTYCFEEAPAMDKPFAPVHMSEEVASRAVSLFGQMAKRYGSPDKKKTIHLYGGEPLMNKTVVRASVLQIRDFGKRGILPDNCEIAIVTNGMFLDDATVKFFVENGVTVGLSLDGPGWMNNAYRLPKRDGVDVFREVKKSLGLLKDNGAKIGLSVALTPLAIEHFPELLDFLLGEMGGVDGVSLNLLHYNRNVVPPPDYYVRAAQCQLAAFERFRELGIYEERVMRKAKAFIDRRPLYADCGVIGNQLVIAPDGRIGVCQDFVKPRTYFQGNVLDPDPDPVADGLFRDWRRRSPFFMEQCFGCEAIGICGGGCPASAELKTGSRWNLDERACPHSKLTLEWLVWETCAKLS